MSDPQGVISRISWRDLFPWLIIFRTFRLAISPTLLALAAAAVIVAPLGWRVGGFVFLPRQANQAILAPRAEIPRAANSQLAQLTPPAIHGYLPAAPSAIVEAYLDLAEPLKRFFQLKMTVGETAYYALGTLWTLALWAFVGGAITRRAVVQLAQDSPLSIPQTLSYACRRYSWYLLAPLYPLLGILLLTIFIALPLGLPVRLAPGLGSILAGLAWILVALAGLGAAWLLVGLLFGWPLMWPTVSAERDGDPFEAFSRSYSYVYGKPLHYFFYVVIAAAFGALCWAAVEIAARIVLEFGFWALAWGGGGENVERIRAAALTFAAGGVVPTGDNRALGVGVTLIGVVVALIQALATAFRFTYFFSAASAIYLLLRQDVDEKEMDEVYLEPEREVSAAPRPPEAVPAPPSAASSEQAG